MHQLNVVTRYLKGDIPISRVVAEQLETELVCGKVVVVVESPMIMLSSVRKQWVRMARKVEVERAKTFDATQISQLAYRARVLRHTRFTAKPPDDQLEADVTFATAERLVRFAPECHTLIVTYEFEKIKLYKMTAWMPRHGTVIIYE